MRRTSVDATGADRGAGFATATVLGLLAIIGVLGASALHDALFGEQLAGSRLLHQRAAALAQLGVADGMARIGALESASGFAYALTPLPDSNDGVDVAVRHRGSSVLPQGFSGGRFTLEHFEIESTGLTARGTRMTHTQGASRILAAAPPVTP